MANLINSLSFRRRKAPEQSITLTPAEAAILSRMPDQKGRDFIEFKLGVPIHKFADYNSYIAAGTKKVWATYRACHLISATAISANYRIIDTTSLDNSITVEPNIKDTDSTAFAKGKFLTRPNPFDTWEELMDMTVFHLELAGNAYWLKDDIDLAGRPSSIFPLLPQNIKLVPSRTEKVGMYEYTVNGTTLKFTPDKIIHFKYSNPNDLLHGLGSVEGAEELYKSFIAKSDLKLKFLENGAQPSGVMTLDDGTVTDDEEWEKLRKKFQVEYAGGKNAGKVAFLNGKWSYHKLGLTMAEMESIEDEKWTVEQIFLNHGVPLSIAGVQGAANYATARMDEMNFRRYKIVPLIDIIVGKINADGFIQKTNPNFKLTYELYGVIDTEQIAKVHLPLVREGIITRNEMREALGFRRIENPLLDQIMVMNHTIPIEMAGLASLSNDDMLRAYGQIVGGDVEDITEGDDTELPEPEPKEDTGLALPPPKKGKSYPARPQGKGKKRR
jgi:HK97 family phage portal protein